MSKRILELSILNEVEEFLDNLACRFKILTDNEEQRTKQVIFRILNLLAFLFHKNPELIMFNNENLRRTPMSIIVMMDGLSDLDWIAKKFKISGSNLTEQRENTILFAVQQLKEIAEKNKEKIGA